jgi:hypothetical protein
MRLTRLAVAAGLILGSLATRDVAADGSTATVPVSVAVVGEGRIRLMVADGTSRPCDSSDDRMLFFGYAKPGDEIKLASATGSVCVDHTYGSLRESQWAGASIWSGGRFGVAPNSPLNGTVSTDRP